MPTHLNSPTPEEINKWFVAKPELDGKTFEFGLVLGGTVSAGAYTAGVLDFLFEALDAWTDAKQRNDPLAPKHEVRLKVIAGASGGGVNAVIAARALAFNYPAVTRGSLKANTPTGNPFFDTWCSLQFDGFLDTADLKKGGIRSLLNGKPIDDAAKALTDFSGGLRQTPRPYLGNSDTNEPLRLILTLSNLHGFPYATDFGGGKKQGFVNHADFVRYAVAFPGQAITDTAIRPDEFTLVFDNAKQKQASTWEDLAEFAKGTAAFPIGLPPRALARPVEHYRWHVVGVPDANGKIIPSPLIVDETMLKDSSGLIPDDYHFLVVDGGATDNEPIELARNELAGFGNRNPRDPKTANRAVLLVDPFAGFTDLGLTAFTKLSDVAFGIINTLVQQNRYATSDLVLAADDSVFSRFMITPTLPSGVMGEKAIASGGLGAFIGFACPAFLRHDYLLGRANCQRFLRKEFLLAKENPIVADHWTDEQINHFKVQDNADAPVFVPIIPLMGDANIDETLDAWPKGKLNPEDLRDAIEDRWRALAEAETGPNFFGKIVGFLAGELTQGKVADFVIKEMKDALKNWGLS